MCKRPGTQKPPIVAEAVNRAADAAENLDLLGADGADDGAFLADDDLLAGDVTADVAVDLQLVLRDDGDLLAEDGEIGADHRGSHGGGSPKGRAASIAGRRRGAAILHAVRNSWRLRKTGICTRASAEHG